MNWPRLITQIVSLLSGLIASGNLGRLTTADGTPGELAVWAGVPALLAAAGGVGQAFLAKPSGDAAKPGSPGHREVCQSVYELAVACEWDRLTAVVKAWQQSNPTTDKKAE
jgi:hypothetical protein